MATTHQRYTVGTSRVRVDTRAQEVDGMRLLPGQVVHVQNPPGLGVVYVGGPNVTTTDYGHALSPGSDRTFTLDRDDQLWAIAPVAGQSLNVLRTRSAT